MNTMYNRFKMTILSMVILLLFSGCKTQDKNEIVITQAFDNLLYLGLYVANEGGFFEKEGLKVTIQTAGGDQQAMDALTSGNCNIAQCDPSFAAIVNEKGWDARVIGVVVNKAAFWGVTYDKNLDTIRDIKQLKGKTIAVYPYPNTAYVIQEQLLEQNGLKIGKDVTLIQVSMGTELATLNGRADIAQTIEPNVATVEGEGGKCVLSYPDFYGDIAFSGLIVSRQYLEKNRETLIKFIRAYNSAMAFVHENPNAACQILVKHFSDIDSQKVTDAAIRLIESQSIGNNTYVREEAWNKLMKIRKAVRNIERIPIFNDVVDNSLQDNQQ